MMSVNDGEILLCDGCGKLYWQDAGDEYSGPHYQLIREEEGTCDEGTRSTETGTETT